MYAAQLSITDRFVEFGNLFFNVKDTGREYKYDLHYEETSQDPVNRFMVDNEERIDEFYNFLHTIIDFIVGIFTKSKTNSGHNFDNISTFDRQKMRTKNGSLYKNLSSQQVIRNNVRNRLLQAISIQDKDDNNSLYKEKTAFNFIKVKFNSFFKDKEEVLVKNRYMGTKS